MNPVLLGGSDQHDKLQDDKEESSEESEVQRFSYVGYNMKLFFSTLLQCLCIYYLMTHLIQGHSIVAAPAWVLLLVILLAYYIVFLAEGMKVAIVGIAHLSQAAVEAAGYDMVIYSLLQGIDARTHLQKYERTITSNTQQQVNHH